MDSISLTFNEYPSMTRLSFLLLVSLLISAQFLSVHKFNALKYRPIVAKSFALKSTQQSPILLKLEKFFQADDESSFVPLEYNAAEIDKFYSSRPGLVWERMINIGSPIIGWGILKVFDSLISITRSPEQNKLAALDRAKDFKDAIVQGRSVTLIKSGQALALRPDLLKSLE